jgi:uncharacterized protein YebE (UPF0316 family)
MTPSDRRPVPRITAFFGGRIVSAYLLPLVIFLAELSVVTLMTVRLIAVSRGLKRSAAFIGFFEIGIWLFTIGQIMGRLSDPLCWLAYAGGFTLGNYLGVTIDEKLALGTVLVRLITPHDPLELIDALKAGSYGVTRQDAHGSAGPVRVLLTVVTRKELPDVLGLIQRFEPAGFYAVEELQTAARGVFPLRSRGGRRSAFPSARASEALAGGVSMS